MKYQALVLVIIILFSTFMLRSLSLQQRAILPSSSIPESITRLGTYEVPSLSQRNKFQAESLQELQNIASRRAASSSQTITAVIEKPSVGRSIPLCAVQAAAFLVKDIIQGSNILSQNETGLRPIASVSKLMTTLIAVESLDPSTVVSITKEIHAQADGYASLEVDASYTVQDLIRAALVVSSNDAAYALATSFGYEAFIARMNEKAKEIGMAQTIFSEPSGLSYLNQSTATDLALLLEYIYRVHPELFAITREKLVPIVNQTRQRTIQLSNVNYFAGTKDFIGGKTGFINESGGNLITLFNHVQSVWAVEVLGSNDRFGDVSKLLLCAQKMQKQ